MRVHPLSEEEKITQVQLPADAGTGAAAHYGGLDFREVPFLVIGEKFEELFAHDQSQDGVTQKLEPFVRGQSGVRTGSVGQGRSEEFGLAKAVLDRFLALLQNFRLAAYEFLLH